MTALVAVNGTARAAFIERRRSGIGGSDVAAILGFSQWRDAIRVYLEKRGLVETDETAVMERGRYREEALVRWYRDTKNVERLIGPVDERPDGASFFRHPEMPWLVGNLDEEVRNAEGEEWIVDAKCSFARGAQYGEEGTDNIPDDAFWQGMHYCFIRQRPRVDFIVERLGAWPPRIYSVQRDDELYALVLPQLRKFWYEHVLAGSPPPPNFADPKVIEAIKALHPALTIERRAVELPAAMTFKVAEGREVALNTLGVLEMIEFLKARQKRDESIQRRLDALIRHHIGDAQVGLIATDDGAQIEAKRIFNRGGERPATTIAPYDYLKTNWPKGHTHVLAGDTLRLIEGEVNG